MYVIVGIKAGERRELWAGKSTCPNCKKECNYHLYRDVLSASVYFIPIFSITKRRYLRCDSCWCENPITRREYSIIKKKQMNLFYQNGFPTDMVLDDFEPDSIGYTKQRIKLVLSGIFFAFAFLVFLIDAINIGFRLFDIVMIAILSIPFILSLKNFIPKLKMKAAYEKAISKLH